MATTFIYALCEPHSRVVRYIGKANDPAYRFKQHLRQSVRAESHLGNWLRSLLSQGEKPVLVVLRGIPDGHWEVAEERYIRLAKGLGMNLVNATNGGDGVTMTPETLTKLRVAATGRRLSMTTRGRMRQAKLGVPNSAESNARISTSLKGRTCSKEHNANNSAAKKNKPHTKEHISNQSAAMKASWARRKAAKA